MLSALALAISLANIKEIHEVQSMKVGSTEYKLWQFTLKQEGQCPHFLMLQKTTPTKKELLDRLLRSCSGVGRLSREGGKILISVPSDDNTIKTFEYTYIYSAAGKWLDTGRSK